MLKDRGTIKWTSLMLPEHIELLKAMWQEDKKIAKPILDEQELEILNRQLIAAHDQQLPITITVYHDDSMTDYVGIVTKIDKSTNSIRLFREHGTTLTIAFHDILAIN